MNVKGSFFDGITIMVGVFVLMIFVIIALVVWNGVKEPLRAMNPSAEVNLTIAGMTNVEHTYDYVGIGMWFFFVIASLGLAALAGANPLFAIASIIMVMIEIIISIGLSNAYRAIIQDPNIASYVSSLTWTNTLFVHLPKFAVVTALLAGLFMYLSTRNQ